MFHVMTHGCDLSTVDAKTEGSMGLNVQTSFRSARHHLKQGCMWVGGAAEEIVWRLKAHNTLPEYPYRLLL